MKRFAKPEFLELVRQDAQQIEIGARTHHFRGFVQQLNFAGGVGNRAVLFVGRGCGENDVRLVGGFRQKHFVHDQQV